MKPIMQTKFTNIDWTVHGNCLSACLASLFELSLDEVPALENANGEWFSLVWEFLKTRNCTYAGTHWIRDYAETHLIDDKPAWWHYLTERSDGIDGYFIVSGLSPRTWVKRGHSVIYHNGVMVHDPYPGAKGLLEPQNVMMIERMEIE